MSTVSGAFGKIPALGDFFRIGLPVGFTAPWDSWLQTTLQAARAQLQGRWQACYFSAPIWRFTLAGGVIGPWSVQGVLMPSVDRVGREFPLTLAMMLPPVDSALGSHLASEMMFAGMEDLALAALEDSMTRDHLAAALAALPAPGGGGSAAMMRQDVDHYALILPSNQPLGALQVSGSLARPVIWTTHLDGRDLVMGAAHLLPDRRAAMLFDPLATFVPEKGP